MKIYIVTKGSYSDYHICAIFSTEEKAQRLVDSLNRRWNTPCIEEYEIDAVEIPKGYKNYFVRMTKEGSVLEQNISDSTYFMNETGFDINQNIFSYQFAEDETHAVKITNERRVQKIANNEWPIKK